MENLPSDQQLDFDATEETDENNEGFFQTTLGRVLCAVVGIPIVLIACIAGFFAIFTFPALLYGAGWGLSNTSYTPQDYMMPPGITCFLIGAALSVWGMVSYSNNNKTYSTYARLFPGLLLIVGGFITFCVPIAFAQNIVIALFLGTLVGIIIAGGVCACSWALYGKVSSFLKGLLKAGSIYAITFFAMMCILGIFLA